MDLDTCVIPNRVRYGAAPVFTRLTPPLQWPGGVILVVIPAPLPSGSSSPYALDGAPFLPTCFNRNLSGERVGPTPEAGNPKRTPSAPGRSAGWGIGHGVAFFRAPDAL